MLWFAMLMALTAVIALDLANAARPAVFRRRDGAAMKRLNGQQGASDGGIRSARNT